MVTSTIFPAAGIDCFCCSKVIIDDELHADLAAINVPQKPFALGIRKLVENTPTW